MLAGHLPLIVTNEDREREKEKERVINVRNTEHTSVKISPSILLDLG